MKTAIVIPNWNGANYLRAAIDSVLAQTTPSTIIVVDNGSQDQSRAIIDSYGQKIISIYHENNLGFTGGVNAGITYAIDHHFDAVALLNNDAIVSKDWLSHLILALNDPVGIATSFILSSDGNTIDTTGDMLTTWGLSYPRLRGQPVTAYGGEINELIFGASGGASLYSIPMLKEIGLFDQDFFAYYEDADLSWRAQQAGWKIMFVPKAKVLHRIGATSSKIKGFTTYHTFKNLWLLIIKNTPKSLRRIIYPRFFLAYSLFQLKALFSKNALAMIRGSIDGLILVPQKIAEKRKISSHNKVTDTYILSILVHDLPEESEIRKLRSVWWKLTHRT